MSQANNLEEICNHINDMSTMRVSGKINSIRGLSLQCKGLSNFVSIGSRCTIHKRNNETIESEVVAMEDNKTYLMPFGDIEDIGVGCKVTLKDKQFYIYPDLSWQGRVINAMAMPVDKLGNLKQGSKKYLLKNTPLPAHDRAEVGVKINTGIKVINSFLPLCKGQRMGIFAGSGVGKSVLISMLSKYADADIKIIGLIGERGRELHEFLNKYMGEEGLKKCIVVVATGDEPAIIRRQAAYLTLAISEYFRDLGKEVLCIIDSLTRFAMAQREIGLANGEPPSAKGYTPTVFSELPKLLERAGPGLSSGGNITGLFSVLVDGDDHNEPIADAVRGILDGHIVLERQIAERNIFPAVNILKSISRTMPGCNTEKENILVSKARSMLSIYYDMIDMIRIGAYKKGTDNQIDIAIDTYPEIESFIKQQPNEMFDLESCNLKLQSVFKS